MPGLSETALDQARGHADHKARIFGDEAAGCENCGTARGFVDTIWTDDGRKLRLCEDCAGEVRRLERLADELAERPSCVERARIIDGAQTTAGLVNRLLAHDMAQCSACVAARDGKAA